MSGNTGNKVIDLNAIFISDDRSENEA